MTVLIRALNRETDMDEWRRMRYALWPDYTESDMAAEMNDLLATIDRQPVFVAVAPDGRLCGLMETNIRAWAEGCTTDRVGYLEAWWVDPQWRRNGLGRRLAAEAEAWARAQGCVEMASDTNADYPLSPTAHMCVGYEIVGRSRGDIFFRKAL